MTDETPTTMTFNPPLLWLAWTLATAGGWLGGVVINFLVINLLGLGALAANPDQVSQETALLLLAVSLGVLLVLGGSIGLLQWFVLRQQVPGVNRWPLATAAGFAVGAFAYPVLFLGLGIGLLQWLVLRRDLNKTSWWLLLSAAAWPVAYVVGLIISSANAPLMGGLVSAFVSGAFAGGLTGGILIWLLRQNRELLEGLRQEQQETAK